MRSLVARPGDSEHLLAYVCARSHGYNARSQIGGRFAHRFGRRRPSWNGDGNGNNGNDDGNDGNDDDGNGNGGTLP